MSSGSSDTSASDSYYLVSVDIDLFEDYFIASFDISEEVSLSARYEHDRLPFGTGSPGTTDSVNVRFRIFRDIVVYYKHNIFHIESASCDICGDEYITESVRKPFERSGSISLLHISMETPGREYVPFEHIRDILGFVFHSTEYDYLHSRMILNVFFEHIVLLEVRNFYEGMVDFRYHEIFRRFDGFVSVSDIFCEEIIHFLRNSRRESHGLFHASESGPDHIDIVDESHIEHTIDFVENEVLHMGKIDKSPFDKVDKTPCRGNHHLRSGYKRFPLRSYIGSSVYGNGSEIGTI